MDHTVRIWDLISGTKAGGWANISYFIILQLFRKFLWPLYKIGIMTQSIYFSWFLLDIKIDSLLLQENVVKHCEGTLIASMLLLGNPFPLMFVQLQEIKQYLFGMHVQACVSRLCTDTAIQ